MKMVAPTMALAVLDRAIQVPWRGGRQPVTGTPTAQAPGSPAGWEHLAAAWMRWARDSGLNDDFWSWHLDTLLEALPTPSGLTVDVASGGGGGCHGC